MPRTALRERVAEDTLTLPPPAPAAAPLRVRAYGTTDPGRVRERNEDQFLIAQLSRTLRVRRSSLPRPPRQRSRGSAHVLLVADGMGGHSAGEVASALSVEAVEAFVLELLGRPCSLRDDDESGVIRDLREAVQLADARVFGEGLRRPELAGMGATLVLAFVSGDKLFVIHAGDSRAYLLRNYALTQLTEDHTLVANMVSRGLLTPEQARRHPHRHMITNAVGGSEVGVRVDVQRVTLEAGDVVLLCSDGLTDMVGDEEIARALTEEGGPRAACERLVEEANAAGGKDNVTVVVARFDQRA